MGRSSAGLLGLVVAFASANGGSPARAAEDLRPAPPPARTPEFVEKVDRAVDMGVLWLVRKQQVDGSFSLGAGSYPFVPPYDLGLQALSVYTARSCGLPADDDAARLGFKRMRQIYLDHRRARLLQNYQVSLTLLAIDAYHAPGGDPGKSDRYGKSLAPKRNIPEADLSWIRELVAWLVAAQTPDGSFGYTSPPSTMYPGNTSAWEDHSNAQFSLLALKAARRCGVEVPRRVFQAALRHFLDSQEKEGPAVARRVRPDPGEKEAAARNRSTVTDHARGWGYQCGARMRKFTTGSMTTAGISSLVICRGELLGSPGFDAADDARVVQAVRDGIAWLGRNFSITGNPNGRGNEGSWHYYYLYGLERAGILSGISWMGDHDWYGEGAGYLVGRQREGGGWTSSGSAGARGQAQGPAGAPGDLMETCFALLFLKKATFRVEGAVATEDSEGDLDLAGAADLDDDSFRAVFDTVFARCARSGAQERGARIVDFVRMGKRALPLLIQRLEDADAGVQGVACQVLENLTGANRGFRAGDPVEARAAAVAAWEEWWFARRGKLAADVGAGRFRE